MIRNYFKIALRNIFRHKIYSFLNIGGLALGIATFIFIALYVTDELSYDRYHSKADRIYRVNRLYTANTVEENAATCSFPFAPALENANSDLIEKIVRFFNFQQPRLLVEHEDIKFNEPRVFLADSTVFDIFDFEFITGNPENALDRPFTMVITESTARKYFGDENPVGKSLRFQQQLDFEITGIIKDIQPQSHFQFDFLGALSSFRQIVGGQLPQTWIWNPCWTYVLLKEGVKPEQLEARFPDFHQNHYFDFPNQNIKLYLMPLTDIHLRSHLVYEITQNSNISYIYLLSAIAIFVLIIASINFMNLSTAGSAGRSKEIGVKKLLGAQRPQLIRQFLSESVITTFIALIIALVLIEIFLAAFNNFTAKAFDPALFLKPRLILLMVFFGLSLGVLSGIYPAFFLSAFKPIKVLKGNLSRGSRGATARKILVILQFSISVTLIVATLIIFKQLQYMRRANLGFKKDHIILLPISLTPLVGQYEAFRTELLTSNDITHVTGVEDIPGVDHNTHRFIIEGLDPDKPLYYPCLNVRYDFLETFEIPVVVGRAFSNQFPSDTTETIMINEAMVKHLGWTNENAIGRSFRKDGNERVIGVFRNFNALSLHAPEETFVLDMIPPLQGGNFFLRYAAVRINTDDYQRVLNFIEEKWNQFAPGNPFEYRFLDEQLDNLYRNEDKLGELAIVLTMLAIIIACLGLFGLTSFLALQRTREIGIRKALGASVTGIVYLISREFLILVMAANIIAIPVSVLIMQRWLQNFAYRSGISIWPFLIAAFAALLVAFLTVSYQAIKSALIDPSKALRYE
jgi:putative ABC transport system permease protein